MEARRNAQTTGSHPNDRLRVMAPHDPSFDAPEDDNIGSRTERSPYASTLQGTEPPPYRTMESLALPVDQPSTQNSVHGRRQDNRDNGSQNGRDFADFMNTLRTGTQPHNDRTLALSHTSV